MFVFYTPWKHQKSLGFLVFSENISWEHWRKIGRHQPERQKLILHSIFLLFTKKSGSAEVQLWIIAMSKIRKFSSNTPVNLSFVKFHFLI